MLIGDRYILQLTGGGNDCLYYKSHNHDCFAVTFEKKEAAILDEYQLEDVTNQLNKLKLTYIEINVEEELRNG
jgi:hypothetical protein